VTRITPRKVRLPRARNRPYCTESGKAIGDLGEPNDKWTCVRCLRKPLRLRLDGEHVVVPRHREWASPDLVAMVIGQAEGKTISCPCQELSAAEPYIAARLPSL
jgi:hypothetical protein